jgi:hypothetical protein
MGTFTWGESMDWLKRHEEAFPINVRVFPYMFPPASFSQF